MPDEKLLTINQAAARLGVHQNTLRGWADKGMVPMVKLPSGYRRFRPSDIDAERQKMGLDPYKEERAQDEES